MIADNLLQSSEDPGRKKEHEKSPLIFERDISQSVTFADIWRRYEEWLQPTTDALVDFADISFSPNGKCIAGIATVCKEMKGHPSTRLAITNIENCHVSTFGGREGSDSHPRWSPDGRTVSFLSEINGYSQLHLLDVESGNIHVATDIQGTIEQQSWSQDGQNILLTVAGLGADVSGVKGGHAITLDTETPNDKAWMPSIETVPAADAYRYAWNYEIASGSAQKATPDGLNVWQAVWTSSSNFVGICSDLPGEEDWYHSTLREVSIVTGAVKELFTTDVSMEWLSASASGTWVAFASGVASDRQILTGDLHILEVASQSIVSPETLGVNVNAISWCGDHDLLASGIREDEDVIIHYSLQTKQSREIWASRDYSVNGEAVCEISAFKGTDGEIQCAFVRTGWFSPPTLVVASASRLEEIKAFSSPVLADKIRHLGKATNLKWAAPDGLDIYGYLVSPSTPAPHPTILHVHGGPVWGWRPRYLGKDITLQALLDEGYAIFEPNPRGSWGRGDAFTRRVYGDMGGADTYDYLSGLDALVDSGQADPKRLGVFGMSYGGFMSAWLPSQSDRFAASIPISPVTDWVSEHLTGNLGRFCQDFLADDIHNPTGRYFTRSPVHHVTKVKTPTMQACGMVDKNCPVGQGVEFHHALVEQGTPSVLLTYPGEGHGVEGMPGCIDLLARSIEWWRAYLV